MKRLKVRRPELYVDPAKLAYYEKVKIYFDNFVNFQETFNGAKLDHYYDFDDGFALHRFFKEYFGVNFSTKSFINLNTTERECLKPLMKI